MRRQSWIRRNYVIHQWVRNPAVLRIQHIKDGGPQLYGEPLGKLGVLEYSEAHGTDGRSLERISRHAQERTAKEPGRIQVVIDKTHSRHCGGRPSHEVADSAICRSRTCAHAHGA